MRTRWWIVALAAAAVMLGLAAPASSTPAPEARHRGVVVPDGRALIHIEGGSATAHRLGTLRYRITVPREVYISWLGQVSGEEHVGSFTARQLVRAWNGMGYRSNVRALATLVWGSTPESRATNHRVVLLSEPRVAPGGRLTFTATALLRGLPHRMTFLEFHIARAGAAPVTPPLRNADTPLSPSVTFTPLAIDSTPTAWIQAAETDNISGTVTWPTAGEPCRGPINVTADPSTGVGQVVFQGFPCGDGTVNGQAPLPTNNKYVPYVNVDSTVTFQPMVTADGSGMIWAQYGYTPTGSSKAFYVGQTLGLWDANGCILFCTSY